jgi:hypothetical protein
MKNKTERPLEGWQGRKSNKTVVTNAAGLKAKMSGNEMERESLLSL